MMDLEAARWTAILEEIPGLDVSAGLRTVGGRPESLVRLLRKYEGLHAEDGARLAQVLQGEGVEAAQLLAHSLKGAAGFLGLAGIQSLATELDQALRGTTPGVDLAALITRFSQENCRVCEAIRSLCGA